MRKLLLALSMATVAVMGVLMPASASAQTMPVQATPAAAADVDYELNFAVAGTPPPKSQMECRSYPDVEICWEPAGDHWWVQDQNSDDGASAGVHWMNFKNHSGGDLYRQGHCMTSLGKGNWGHCNKNYYEDSRLYGNACTWNRNVSNVIVCNNQQSNRYQ